jgi:hypothetical protein
MDMNDNLKKALFGQDKLEEQGQEFLNNILKNTSPNDAKAIADIACGGQTVGKILFCVQEIKRCMAHLEQDHKSFIPMARVENMVIDALGIEWRRFKAMAPDECACSEVGFSKCMCPIDAEIDLVKSGRRMGALKAMVNRLKLGIAELKKSLDFYCPE